MLNHPVATVIGEEGREAKENNSAKFLSHMKTSSRLVIPAWRVILQYWSRSSVKWPYITLEIYI